ncbi:Bax inhibitor 1-like isoform 2 [Achlya hypogyna]|uniref:Bax inhibitor 1-like isoform 2 n=1 Tax=Achlya hypogyna TaxID=1202772 RepID=A0A1V9Z5N0_ACHHY|nr:Bax inhibitor 1-like isoform 2 [Achlya hypogyna]
MQNSATEKSHLNAPVKTIESADVPMASERPTMTWEIVSADTAISAHIRSHLRRVYITLGLMLLFAAGGVAFDFRYHLPWWVTCLVIPIPLFIAILCSPTEWMAFRMSCSMLLAASLGAGTGGLVKKAAAIDPILVAAAFGCTTLIFVIMSLCAYCSERRSAIFLSGFLMSALLILAVLSIVNIFVKCKFLYLLGLYGGLLLFSIYVIVDTQLIVERAVWGETDFVSHALELFLDFFNIFIRILAILTNDDD